MIQVSYNRQEILIPDSYNLDKLARTLNEIRSDIFWEDFKIVIYEDRGDQDGETNHKPSIQDFRD